jgi:dTDP-4-dehydrorhamnose reductase
VKILLTGPRGQVGSALVDTLPALGDLVALDKAELDLARPESVRAVVKAVRPDVIVNAAAYTAVDRAEVEEPLARVVNRDSPAVLAEEAAKRDALVVHFSTDYVFDGNKPSPYVETDATAPLNAYGRTKLAGEQAIAASGCRHAIVRTSWVYAASGKNFLLTMLRLAREGKPIRVVDDQFGAPTSNRMLAEAIPRVISALCADTSLSGIYHMSAAGKTTWYQFARAIIGSTAQKADVAPISTDQYRSAAQRPRNSVLENGKLASQIGIRLPAWEAGLPEVLQALR